jgi:hypothetical protein
MSWKAHSALESAKGAARQELHLHSAFKAGVLLLRLALFAPGEFGKAPGVLVLLEAGRHVPGRRPAGRGVAMANGRWQSGNRQSQITNRKS